MTSLKLVSINIERSKHLGRVMPFLKASQADVVCVQELNRADIEMFETELDMQSVFTPHGIHPQVDDEAEEVIGIAVFARNLGNNTHIEYYRGSEAVALSAPPLRVFPNNAIINCDIPHDDKVFTVATTHFPWTPDGLANDAQREDLPKCIAILERLGAFIFCGDLNAPRGGEIFSQLVAHYNDNIPAEYTTSIDKDLHRAGDLQLMVDGLFTTPEYIATEVSLVSGVSDHMAIVATISTA